MVSKQTTIQTLKMGGHIKAAHLFTRDEEDLGFLTKTYVTYLKNKRKITWCFEVNAFVWRGDTEYKRMLKTLENLIDPPNSSGGTVSGRFPSKSPTPAPQQIKRTAVTSSKTRLSTMAIMSMLAIQQGK
jgi:hypothetical protein